MNQVHMAPANFLLLTKAIAVATLALTLLLLATILSRRLVLPSWVYVLSAILGISGWLASFFVTGQMHWPLSGRHMLWPLIIILAPQVMLAEASLVGWLGSRAWWRSGFLIGIITGVLSIGIQLRGFVSLRHHL
jgi:hypothetical protein